jgi:transcriptional regulator with XRE-family HTH domain
MEVDLRATVCDPANMSESQPTISRRSLGRTVWRRREEKGISRAQLGRAIGYSGQTIQRIEEGTQATRSIVVEKICAELGIGNVEMSHLTTLAARGTERGWWEPYFDIGTEETSRPKIPLFLETEQTARRISVVETEVMPGLLQTPEYLQALQEAQLPMTEEVALSWRALRTKRQEMLYGRHVLPRMEFVIGKAAIDYLDALDSSVRDGQVQRLLEVSAMPTAQVRVITGLHAATAGAFNILYPDDETEPFIFSDAADGCRYVEQPQLVSMYESIFELARDKSTTLEEYLR